MNTWLAAVFAIGIVANSLLITSLARWISRLDGRILDLEYPDFKRGGC